MRRWLYDTSVIVALEGEERLGPLPVGDYTVSVITIGELQLGVHLGSPEDLSMRLELIAEVEHAWSPVPVDVRVMRRYASMVADCRRRGIRPGVADSIIAATASVHGLGVVTRDHDFTRFQGIEVEVV